MKIVKPSVELLNLVSGITICQHLEKAVRTCYKSEDLTTGDSFIVLLKKMINSHHYSTLEHVSLTARFILSRTAMTQLTRHRIASYSCESQRFCNYSRGKFGSEIAVIKPFNIDLNTGIGVTWKMAVEDAEGAYMGLIAAGLKAQDARSVLPGCAKTEIMVTMNPRAWMEFFEKRCTTHAQDEIRFLAKDLLGQMKGEIPVLFDDLYGRFCE